MKKSAYQLVKRGDRYQIECQEKYLTSSKSREYLSQLLSLYRKQERHNLAMSFVDPIVKANLYQHTKHQGDFDEILQDFWINYNSGRTKSMDVNIRYALLETYYNYAYPDN